MNHNKQPKTLLLLASASHPNLQYLADFAPELGLIIMETKYLEQLGFQVPELARNVSLQVCHEITNSVSCRFIGTSSRGNSLLKTYSSSNKAQIYGPSHPFNNNGMYMFAVRYTLYTWGNTLAQLFKANPGLLNTLMLKAYFPLSLYDSNYASVRKHCTKCKR